MNSKTRKILLIAGAAAAGTAIVYRTKRRKYDGIKMKKSIVIDRAASELYDFWHDFQNLPTITDMLKDVEVLDVTRSLWTVDAPGGVPVKWEAEITKDIRDEMIGWRSIDGSPIETAGYVRFEELPGGHGTVVRVALEYYPPAGTVGAGFASMFGKNPGTHLERMLGRFKQLMETGGIATGERTGAFKSA